MNNLSIVIEKRNDGFFYIGITDGERDDFFIYARTLTAALEAAEFLKYRVEGCLLQVSEECYH